MIFMRIIIKIIWWWLSRCLSWERWSRLLWWWYSWWVYEDDDHQKGKRLKSLLQTTLTIIPHQFAATSLSDSPIGQHSTLQLPRSVVEPFQQIVLAVLAIWKSSFNWNISAMCENIDVLQSRRNACSRQNVQKPIPTFNHPVAMNSGVLDIIGTLWQAFSWILWEYFVFHLPIWANICWPPTKNYFPNSWHQTTWSVLVAFKIVNSQLHCL